MRFSGKSFCIAAVCLALFSCRREEACLVQVDKAMEMRPVYERNHRARIDSLESLIPFCNTDSAKFDVFSDIFELFKCNDIDSADYYAGRMAAIRDDVYSRSAKAAVLSPRKNYSRAFELLDGVDRSGLSERELLALYEIYQSVCSAVNNDSGISDADRQANKEKKLLYQRKTVLLEDLTPFEKLYYNGRLLASEGRTREAVEMLRAALKEKTEPQKALHCTFAIAGCLKELGDMGGYLEMLCETVSLDFSICNRQYSSLYDLALYLYERGDYKRAGDYIQTTIIDAIRCNYNIRIVNAVVAQDIITAASMQRERNLKGFLSAGIVILICFCVLILVLYLRIRRRNHQIKAINNRVRELNGCLKEEVSIKDRCLFRYMTLPVKFIDNIEDYRRLLRKTLKEDGIDSLKEKLSQQEYLYMQYDTFYKLFDEIFISIFPDFVDKINSLLPDDQKYELKKGGSFPTELRILAVMRLGITKSSHIAEFLNCPVGSVYTNKANLKIKLGCSDSSLVELLSKL